MNPRDLLDVADDLATGTREADWRSAVSRAYYAAFHVGQRLLRQCGFHVPQAEHAHGYVWLRLCNAGHPDVRQSGFRLKDLRQLRNWADYDLDRPVAQNVAIDQVRVAVEIVESLDEAAGEPAVRTRITDAMKVYERDVLRQVTWHP